MKRIAAIISSAFIPGLGQCFYGCFGWAALFFFATCLFGPLCNVLAVLHIFTIKD
jgi:hypothetical protein